MKVWICNLEDIRRWVGAFLQLCWFDGADAYMYMYTCIHGNDRTVCGGEGGLARSSKQKILSKQKISYSLDRSDCSERSHTSRTSRQGQ